MTFSRPERKVIPLLLLGAALFIVNMGFGMFTPILPQYAARLGIDTTSLAFAYSLYNVALIVCLIPGGIIADRLGRVKTIFLGLVLFSLASLLMVYVNDLPQFAAARVVEGVGSALAIPAVLALTADLAPPGRRASGMGFTSTMEDAGNLAGPTLGGMIAQTAGFSFPFYVASVMGLLSGTLVIPIKERPCSSRDSSESSPLAIFDLLRRGAVQSRSLLVLCIRGFIIGITQGLYVLVLVLYMAFEVAMQPAEVGFSFSLITASILAFTFLAGHLSDRFGRKPFVIMGGIIIGVGVLAFPLTSSALQVYMVCSVLGLGIALNNAPINALLADYVLPEIRAKVMGGYGVIVGLGRTLGVMLLGILYAISPTIPFGLSGALVFMTVVLVALFVTEPHGVTGLSPD